MSWACDIISLLSTSACLKTNTKSIWKFIIVYTIEYNFRNFSGSYKVFLLEYLVGSSLYIIESESEMLIKTCIENIGLIDKNICLLQCNLR